MAQFVKWIDTKKFSRDIKVSLLEHLIDLLVVFAKENLPVSDDSLDSISISLETNNLKISDVSSTNLRKEVGANEIIDKFSFIIGLMSSKEDPLFRVFVTARRVFTKKQIAFKLDGCDARAVEVAANNLVERVNRLLEEWDKFGAISGLANVDIVKTEPTDKEVLRQEKSGRLERRHALWLVIIGAILGAILTQLVPYLIRLFGS